MTLKLMYITNNPDIARIAEKSGVDRIFVDMEYIGKDVRQGGMDTVKNHHTIKDVVAIRKVIKKTELIVRVNPIHNATKDYYSSEEEINDVIAAGADIIMLPFFKTASEVKRFVKIVDGRCRTMLLLETRDGVKNLDEILKIRGIDEIHIGLNDLHLDYGMNFMFEPLSNGLVAKIVKKVKRANIPFGFGGIARVGEGELSSEIIIAEHYRLGSTMAILSRSFCDSSSVKDTDTVGPVFSEGVKNIRSVEKDISKKGRWFFLKNRFLLKRYVEKICDRRILSNNSGKIFVFIVLLRALATIIITNSHYEGVYPSNIVANGGLLGDVMFFAVSGYCLCNVKGGFIKWYLKRIVRIFPALWLITTLYCVMGCYSLAEHDAVWWFIFPTYYHFVASIMILYIPFYFIFKLFQDKKRRRMIIPIAIACSMLAQLIVYFFFYDKTYYHIDTVREPMIRFLFFDAMMIGAYFRVNQKERIINKKHRWIILLVLGISYFGFKTVLTKKPELACFQILNQFILAALLVVLFYCFNSIEDRIKRMPLLLYRIVSYLANITLEIYLVQYVIIDWLRNISPFPLNWLSITSLIVISASILHLISVKIQKLILWEKR